MKLDIVRMGQLTELSDAELELVYACGGSSLPVAAAPIAAVPVPAGIASADASETRIHSYAVLCDISIFSLAVNVIPLVNIANPMSQTCANND